MVLMLDSMAQRYGLLPSEVIQRADTLDVEVLIRSVAWNNEVQKRAASGQAMPVQTHHTVDDLQSMIRTARNG